MSDASVPTYFLGSSEFTGDFARPRASWLQAPLQGPDSRQYEWVKVSPPVIGQPFGIGDDIEDLVIAPRHMGSKLPPANGVSTPVQIYIVRNPHVLRSKSFTVHDLEMVAWGEVYETMNAATQASKTD